MKDWRPAVWIRVIENSKIEINFLEPRPNWACRMLMSLIWTWILLPDCKKQAVLAPFVQARTRNVNPEAHSLCVLTPHVNLALLTDCQCHLKWCNLNEKPWHNQYRVSKHVHSSADQNRSGLHCCDNSSYSVMWVNQEGGSHWRSGSRSRVIKETIYWWRTLVKRLTGMNGGWWSEPAHLALNKWGFICCSCVPATWETRR